MKISILMPLMGVAALCASISVRADDNAAQAAARAALLQKMNELDAAQNEPTNQPPASVPAEIQPVTLPSDETQTNQIPAAPPTPGSDYVTTNAMVVMPAKVESPPPTPENQPAVMPQPQMPPVMPAAPISTNPAAMAAPPSNAESENEFMQPIPPTAVEKSTPPPATAKKPGFFSHIFHPFHPTNSSSAFVEVEPQPEPVKPVNANTGLTPIQPPPPPVSPEQEAKLHALLQRYEANQITPEQYQTERAKIINSP